MPSCCIVDPEPNLTKAKLLQFLERLGRAAQSPGRCFITGGGSALLLGWRESTIDLDLSFDPEPAEVFGAIPALKRELAIHVELAAPSDFLPPLPAWRERSRFIGRFGAMEVYHYDFVSQALAKLERGHAKDLIDVGEMLRRGLTAPAELRAHAQAIVPAMARYPALDADSFLRRLEEFLEEQAHD